MINPWSFLFHFCCHPFPPPTRMVVIFFKIDFIFFEKFQVQDRRYMDFPYILCPRTCIAFPIINISNKSGTFLTTDEPTLTCYYHPESIVYITIHSVNCWLCVNQSVFKQIPVSFNFTCKDFSYTRINIFKKYITTVSLANI